MLLGRRQLAQLYIATKAAVQAELMQVKRYRDRPADAEKVAAEQANESVVAEQLKQRRK